MKEYENNQPSTIPGKQGVDVKPEEKQQEIKKPSDAEKSERQGEAGRIPLDHDETIGIP